MLSCYVTVNPFYRDQGWIAKSAKHLKLSYFHVKKLVICFSFWKNECFPGR